MKSEFNDDDSATTKLSPLVINQTRIICRVFFLFRKPIKTRGRPRRRSRLRDVNLAILYTDVFQRRIRRVLAWWPLGL